MANQIIKTTVEDREGVYELFWNGKVYGTKTYLSLTRQRSGSTKKVTFDTATGRIDFSDFASVSSLEK